MKKNHKIPRNLFKREFNHFLQINPQKGRTKKK